MKDYNERYSFLRELLCDERFIQKKYAGGEIPNYICAFPPEEAAQYREMAQALHKDLRQKGARALLVDLYEVMLGMLKDSGSLDDYLAASSLTHKEIMEDFAGVLDNDSEFAPKVAAIIEEASADIALVCGVGEAYPFIRVHALLEKLPSLLSRVIPLVIFYPGTFDKVVGSSALKLFGRLEHMNYYRAFNIFTEAR